jgi:hypothetical protein
MADPRNRMSYQELQEILMHFGAHIGAGPEEPSPLECLDSCLSVVDCVMRGYVTVARAHFARARFHASNLDPNLYCTLALMTAQKALVSARLPELEWDRASGSFYSRLLGRDRSAAAQVEAEYAKKGKSK